MVRISSFLASWILSLGLFSFVCLTLLTGFFQPLMTDDFWCALSARAASSPLELLAYNYMHWSGRFMGGILQWCLLQNETTIRVFGALQGVLFCSLAYFLTWLSLGERPRWKDRGFLAAMTLLLWQSIPTPVYGEAIRWHVSALGYLWTSFFFLLFCIPFTERVMGMWEKNPRTPSYWWLAPLGFILGGLHEMVLCACLPLVLYFLWETRCKDLPKGFYLGMALYIMGAAVNILAPGNWGRGGEDATFTATWWFYVGAFLHKYILAPQLLATVFVTFVCAVACGRVKRATYRHAFVWFLAGLFSLLPIAAVANSGPRMAFFYTLFILCGCGRILSDMRFEIEEALSRWSIAAIAILALCLGESYNLQATIKIAKQLDLRQELIETAKSQGKDTVTVPSLVFPAYGKVYYVDMLGAPLGSYYADYYGVKEIRLAYPEPEPSAREVPFYYRQK